MRPVFSHLGIGAPIEKWKQNWNYQIAWPVFSFARKVRFLFEFLFHDRDKALGELSINIYKGTIADWFMFLSKRHIGVFILGVFVAPKRSAYLNPSYGLAGLNDGLGRVRFSNYLELRPVTPIEPLKEKRDLSALVSLLNMTPT